MARNSGLINQPFPRRRAIAKPYPVIIAGRSADSTGAESVVLLAIHSILVMFIRPGIGMFVLL